MTYKWKNLSFISTLHLKEDEKRQLTHTYFFLLTPYVANQLFSVMDGLKDISLTFGWHCILKLSAEESHTGK